MVCFGRRLARAHFSLFINACVLQPDGEIHGNASADSSRPMACLLQSAARRYCPIFVTDAAIAAPPHRLRDHLQIVIIPWVTIMLMERRV